MFPGMNENKKAWESYDQLLRMLETGEGIEKDSEVEKLYNWCKEKGVKKLRLTMSPEFDGTPEDLAKSINEIQDNLSDPVENLLSRIGGRLFMKKDYVSCMENRVRVTSEGADPIALTIAESRQLRNYKDDIKLLEECEAMIKSLRSS